MKLNLLMDVSRDNPHFEYQPSASEHSTIINSRYPHIDSRKIVKMVTQSIPDAYNIELKRQTDEISRLIDERREYLARVREELAPQIQSFLDQYLDEHPEELL